MRPSDTDLAYLAGLIDGEGSISFTHYFHKHKNGQAYERFRPALNITNTNKQIIDWVERNFGGRVHAVKRKGERLVKDKQAYHWEISHRSAADILKLVRPYLVGKKKQADLFIEYQETATRSHSHGVPLHIFERRKEIAAEVTFLNRRGPAEMCRALV